MWLRGEVHGTLLRFAKSMNPDQSMNPDHVLETFSPHSELSHNVQIGATHSILL